MLGLPHTHEVPLRFGIEGLRIKKAQVPPAPTLPLEFGSTGTLQILKAAIAKQKRDNADFETCCYFGHNPSSQLIIEATGGIKLLSATGGAAQELPPNGDTQQQPKRR